MAQRVFILNNIIGRINIYQDRVEIYQSSILWPFNGQRLPFSPLMAKGYLLVL